MEQVKTGTTTVGLLTKDGLVIAADRRATAGNMIVSRDIKKVLSISNTMLVTTAGSVSEVQQIIKLIRAEIQLKKLKSNREPTVKEVANLLSGMVYRNIRSSGMVSHFLLAGSDNGGNHLYDIFPDGSISEIKDYIASGSGSIFVYGVLEGEYKDNISLSEGKKLVLKAVDIAQRRDSASGNGILMYTITKDGVKEEMDTVITPSIQ